MKLTHEQLVTTLDRLNDVLTAQGVPKGAVQISFSQPVLPESLQEAQLAKAGGGIKPLWECHFEGGVLTCTF